MKKDLCKCGKQKDCRAKKCKSCHNKKLKEDKSYNSNYSHNHAGKKQSKTYMIWQQMKQRCNNPKNKRFKDYGGRGIFVCERWNDFKNFLEDMGEKPEGMQIDRINNDDGYYKENCRYVSPSENCLNRRETFKNKTSRFKGVYWAKRNKMWAVSIKRNQKTYWGGYFHCELEAEQAYLNLKKELENLIS